MSSHLSTGRRRNVALALSRTVTAGLLGLGLATGVAMPALADAASDSAEPVVEQAPLLDSGAPAPVADIETIPDASGDPVSEGEPEAPTESGAAEAPEAAAPLEEAAPESTDEQAAGSGSVADAEGEKTTANLNRIGATEVKDELQQADDAPQEAGPNQAPLAVNDTYEMHEGTTLSVSAPGLLGNDSDPDGEFLQITSHTLPATGTLNTVDFGGAFSYTAPAGFTGDVVFAYSVRDADGATAPGTVTIAVKPAGEPVLQPPVTTADEYFYAVGTPLYIAAPGVLANDDLRGEIATVSLKYAPSNVQVQVNPDGSFLWQGAPYAAYRWFLYEVCTIGGCSEGQVTFTPAAEGEDPSGPASPPNKPPFAANDTATVVEGQTVVASPPGVLANDSDPDGDQLTVIDYATPAHGSVVIFGDGSYSYMAESGYTGPVDIFYTVSDGEEQATASLRVTVQSKTAPVAMDDHYTVVAGETLDVPAPGVLGNDSDPDGDQLALISSTSPQHHASKATWIDGRIKYTPVLGYTGSDSFTYTVTDWKGGESTATIYIDVVSPTPTNQAPIAADDHYSVAAGQTLDVLAPGVLLNDTDPDGDPLTLETVHTGPGTGPLGNWATGRIQYKPKTGFIGTDTLTYIVSDGKGGTDTGTITITVTPAPVLPHAIDDAYQATSGKALEIAAPGLLGNDVCNEPWTPTLNGAGDPLNGTLNWNADGSFTYTPDAGYVGEDGFGYQMSCGTGLYTGEVVITVGAAVSEEPGRPDGSDTPAPGTPAAQPNGDVLARTGSSAQPEMLLAAGIAILLGIIAAFGASRRRARR